MAANTFMAPEEIARSPEECNPLTPECKEGDTKDSSDPCSETTCMNGAWSTMTIDCPQIRCAPFTHLERLPGACCMTCVPDYEPCEDAQTGQVCTICDPAQQTPAGDCVETTEEKSCQKTSTGLQYTTHSRLLPSPPSRSRISVSTRAVPSFPSRCLPTPAAGDACDPDPCAEGTVCVPEPRQCVTTPCDQFRCDKYDCYTKCVFIIVFIITHFSFPRSHRMRSPMWWL